MLIIALPRGERQVQAETRGQGSTFHVKRTNNGEKAPLSTPSSDRRSPRFCDYEGSDYRTAFWEGQGREYEGQAEVIALRKLLPSEGLRIIDIGGGFGRLVDLYRGYREIILMDYSSSQLQDARARLGADRATYVAANLYDMPFVDGSFDAAVMVRVLHHLSDVPKALTAIHSILQPGGAFVLEYANKRNLKAILRYLLRRQAHSPFSHEPWEFVELNFDFHPAYVQNALQKAGFGIERQLSLSHFRIGLLKRHIPPHILARIDGWLQEPTAYLRLTPSMLLRARAAGENTQPLAPTIFRCPSCGSSDLRPEANALLCHGCGQRWSTESGIYDFRTPVD